MSNPTGDALVSAARRTAGKTAFSSASEAKRAGSAVKEAKAALRTHLRRQVAKQKVPQGIRIRPGSSPAV